MKRLRKLRPSPAMVVACIALTVALGGTGVAAMKLLPANSVGSKQIKNGAVTAAKVKTGTLTANKLAAGVIPNMSSYYTKTEVDTNNYTKAQADARYLHGTVTVVGTGPTLVPGDWETLIVNCPAGYQAVGGGADPENLVYMLITSSGPAIDNDWLFFASNGQHAASSGWRVAVHNTSGTTSFGFKAAAICAPIG